MMMLSYFVRSFSALLLACALIAPALVRAQANHNPNETVISRLQPGLWSLHGLDIGSPSKTLCLNNIRMLLQPAHNGAQCKVSVLSSDDNALTVYYGCDSLGHGQTTLTAETSRLAQIDSQGVSEHQPFALSYEARWVGACNAEPHHH